MVFATKPGCFVHLPLALLQQLYNLLGLLIARIPDKLYGLALRRRLPILPLLAISGGLYGGTQTTAQNLSRKWYNIFARESFPF